MSSTFNNQKGKRNFIGERGKNTSTVTRIPEVTRSENMVYTIDEALEVFVMAKKGEGMRERTINDYYLHIKYLKQYLADHHPEYINVSDLSVSARRLHLICVTGVTQQFRWR